MATSPGGPQRTAGDVAIRAEHPATRPQRFYFCAFGRRQADERPGRAPKKIAYGRFRAARFSIAPVHIFSGIEVASILAVWC